MIFLHGGPGGSTSPSNAKFFDPTVYRVVLLDQRGSGLSRPVAEIKENTTQLLVQDIETLRSKLGIRKWHMVFGGSWGSTLALAYAEAHPQAVGSIVLRGVFFGERQEVDKMNNGSMAGQLWPQEFEEFLAYLPEDKRSDPLTAFHQLITGNDREKANEAARVWNKWEMGVSRLLVPDDAYDKLDEADWCIQHATLEMHYFVNGCFFEDQQLYRNLHKLKDIPSKSGSKTIFLAPLIDSSKHRPGKIRYRLHTIYGLEAAQGAASFGAVLEPGCGTFCIGAEYFQEAARDLS